MTDVDRWMLPDGIEEILPDQARELEASRRKVVDLFKSWGYDYVIPPLVEFTDSLLTGSGEDISLLTFKFTDQGSGKTLGLRADITPQVARMDAHSLKREGVNRLCYAGHVLHTRPKWPLASRSPVQAGVELFGEQGLDADLEVISLLLNSLQVIGFPQQYIDLGHVGIYRGLAAAAALEDEKEAKLFELMQSKQYDAVDSWLQSNVEDTQCRDWFTALARLSGDVSILEKAAKVFAKAPESVRVAVNELSGLAASLKDRFPDARLYFDLSELRGYHYLTGIVFGAFAPGVGNAIALGGRYDHIGEAFGRARPATGFTVDLSAALRLVESSVAGIDGIFAADVSDPEVWVEVQKLRAQGERVVCGLSGQDKPQQFQACNRELRRVNNRFEIVPLG
jgi:ATP phosphoribosyltransferase regulatory subunit